MINLQRAVGLMDLDQGPQSLVERPGWASSQTGQHANWPHAGDDALTVEVNFPAASLAALATKRHTVELVKALYGPCSLECVRALEGGVLAAASDPRRDGRAIAF